MKRLTASVTAAALVAGVFLLSLAQAATAAAVHQKVLASDLGAGHPWSRLQDDPGNGGRPHGVQAVSPFADPRHWDGSLHLAVGAAPGQQSQAAHYSMERVPLKVVAGSPIGYDTYVNGSTSTQADAGPALQLPLLCQGAFTTLSFDPARNTDAGDHQGVVPNVWQHFESSPSALWQTSRAVGSIAAGATEPLSTFVSTCTAPGDGVLGVVANVGRLGDAGASLDTYVDNITVLNTAYDFAVPGRTTAHADLRPDSRPCLFCGAPGGRAATVPNHGAGGEIAFEDAAHGPTFHAIGLRLTLAGPRPLSARDVTVTVGGREVRLTAGPKGSLTADVTPRPDADLGADGVARAPIALAWNGGAGGEQGVFVTGELLARGFHVLDTTGIVARTALRI